MSINQTLRASITNSKEGKKNLSIRELLFIKHPSRKVKRGQRKRFFVQLLNRYDFKSQLE